jgi:non-heme chloroperoxidase
MMPEKNRLRNFVKCLLISVCVIMPTMIYAVSPSSEATGKYIKISDDLNLFYHDTGTGPTLLFIPGWTMSSEVFQSQLAYFSKKYRVITLDPRSQGRSSITLENNNYTQHGADLARFIDMLHLKNVILIGWSWGCNDSYAYIRLKGVDNLKAFVCIDVSPKSSGKKGEWAFVDYGDWGSALIQPTMYHRYQFAKVWAQSMVEHKLNPKELNWIINESFRTPTYAALELALDAIYADYRAEAILLDKRKIPTLDFISENESWVAKEWLQKNSPHTYTKVMGKHMMFWEHPVAFNQSLDGFLDGLNK